MNISFDILCNDCGEVLDGVNSDDDSGDVLVDLCETCMSEKDIEIEKLKGEIEGLNKSEKDLLARCSELTSKIRELS